VMCRVLVRLVFVVVCGFVCFGEESELVIREPGDQIWTKCANITRLSLTIPNACVRFTEGQNCAVTIGLSINSQKIFEKDMDTSVAPRVCGGYNFNQGGVQIACNICVSLRDDPNKANQQCVKIEPTCRVPPIGQIPLDPYDAGCFGNEKLAAIEACRNNQCPAPNGAVCSSHGICTAGKCACDTGYFSSDCSLKNNLFEKCQRFDQLGGNVCTRLVFESCFVKLKMVLIVGVLEIPLLERSYPIRTLGTVFQKEICLAPDASGCSLCLMWESLELTDHSARGCGSLRLTCGGTPYGNYPLGCFVDNEVVPACFGTCVNDCSGHGSCDKGMCHCDTSYTGNDCSIQVAACLNNCGGNTQGACNNGVCSCNSDWTGADCMTSNKTSIIPFNPAFIIVPFVLLIGGIAVGIGIWYVKRKKDNSPRFSQFDLLREDEEETTQTPLTTIKEDPNVTENTSTN